VDLSLPRSDETVYAEDNGGKYKFILEKKAEKGLPVDPVNFQSFLQQLMSIVW